ncbi:Uncharacterized membrane protein [Solimonas aquatica]|uniref:Uncharacterized membrane protein n=1 Tax=Solimonas aquatica TaxID=489703 RepID=A0A1H9BQN2_9GAMM|nr:hypothetical protein [Solimonas aquatica]SEP90688.1 Uncharacterized membrane protein [Solimonas aquatica]
MDIVDTRSGDGPLASDAERNTLLIAYILQAISPFTAFSASIISVVISYIKAGETQNHYIRSHHRYLISTFWWTLILGFVFGLLCVIGIGFPLLFGLWVWWIYRLVKGFLAYGERRDMPL